MKNKKTKPMKGVYLRGNRWWIRYRFNGRLIRQSVGDRVLAERMLEEIHRRIQDGRHEIKVRNERRRFPEMIEEYLEMKAEKRSLDRDRASFKSLSPFFGNAFLQTITPNDVDRYKADRRKQVSGATVNRELALLRHLFNLAIDAGYTRDNPVKRVKTFKEQRCKRRAFVFSEDELQALMNAASSHLKPILVVAIGTGLRKGDILALSWNQVSFEHNCITLFMQKTGDSIEIPMLPMVREVLWRLKANEKESLFVFTFRGSKNIGDIKNSFNGALKRANLSKKGYCFHDIRRTFATMLYNRGVHLTKIQRLLGHTSVLTTERYLGVKFEETREAISVLDVPALKALSGPILSTKYAQLKSQPIENDLLSIS